MPYHTINVILDSESNTPLQKLSYANNTRRTLFFNKFDLLPLASFIENGILLITKNGIDVFRSERNDKPLKKYSQFPIRDKLFTLKPDEEFQIFLFSNGAKTEIGISIELDHENNPISSILIPVDLLTQNTILHSTQIIFPRKIRNTGTEISEPINMNGAKTMLVTLKTFPETLELISQEGGNFTDEIIKNNILQSTLTTYQTITLEEGQSKYTEIIIDFGSIGIRNPKVKYRIQIQTHEIPSSNANAQLSTSNDLINYTEIDSHIHADDTDETITLKQGQLSFRYLKFRIEMNVGTQAVYSGGARRIIFSLYSIYNDNTINANAKLDFLEKNPDETNDIIIPASEYTELTVTDTTKKAYIGEDYPSITSKYYKLISSPTDFLAKLTTTDAHEVEITIRKIA